MRIVLDTSVIVSAIRSRLGASSALLKLAASGSFEMLRLRHSFWNMKKWFTAKNIGQFTVFRMSASRNFCADLLL